MKETIGKLLKEVAVNVLIATLIFIGVIVLLHFLGLVVDGDGHLINRWLPLELAAGIIGSAYVLTVKNPNNYFGFALGVIMSLLLAIQFYGVTLPSFSITQSAPVVKLAFLLLHQEPSGTPPRNHNIPRWSLRGQTNLLL